MRQTLWRMVALTAVVVAAACTTVPVTETEPEVLSVAVAPVSVTITPGQSVRLIAMVTYRQGPTDRDVSWSTADDGVATVTDEGVVVGVGGGSATIVATANRDPSQSQAFVVVVTDTRAAQGSVAEPVGVHIAEPHYGCVDTTMSYYVAEVVVGRAYTVSLSDLSDDADLYIYDADSSFSDLSDISDREGTESETARIIASGTTLHVAVGGSYTAEGTCYVLSVSEVTVMSISPPFQGEVDTSMAYFVVQVVPDGIYEVSLTNLTDDVDLYVYDDSTLATPVASSEGAETDDEYLLIRAAGEKLYIGVDGSYSAAGGSFTLDAVSPTLQTVAALPLSARIGAARDYYAIEVVPGEVYEVSLSDLTDDVDLLVYVGFAEDVVPKLSAHEGTEDETIVFSASDAVVYVVLDGSLTDSGSNFTLNVSRTQGPADEGSIRSPVRVTVGEPHRGQVGTGRSYYAVDVQPDTAYEVSLTQLTDDADLYSYAGDSSYYTVETYSELEAIMEEYLSTSSSDEVLYVAVEGSYTDYGARFVLTVTLKEQDGT